MKKRRKDLYKEMRKTGATYQEIATRYGVSRQAVHAGINYTYANYHKFGGLVKKRTEPEI